MNFKEGVHNRCRYSVCNLCMNQATPLHSFLSTHL